MSNTGYIKPLDGLRFVAVSLVLFDHWSGDALGFPASYLGVCMFFVLSGFLITRILLAAREKDEKLGRGPSFSLKRFYIRRTLRIFPLYYLVLVVLVILNFQSVRENWLWLVSYMTNNKIALTGQWLGKIDHLWSLAVEEQYYLFFPFLLFFLPFKNIKHLLLGMVVISVLLRLGLYLSGASWVSPYVLMPTCLDAFGLGGLLAYYYYYNVSGKLKILGSTTFLIVSIAFYALLVLGVHQAGPGHNWISIVLLRLGESVLSLSLIANLICGTAPVSGYLQKALSWQPLVYIGKVSYGIYIFHNLLYNPYHESGDSHISQFMRYINLHFNNIMEHQAIKILFLYGLTLLLASISWYAFEKPINQLKNRYGY